MSTLIVLVTIEVLGLGLILLYVRGRLRKALELDGLMDSLRKEVRALNIELNETADRNISLIEDRMEALRSLVDEVDKRMTVVHKELKRKDEEREVYSKLGRPRPSDPPPARYGTSAPPPPPAQLELDPAGLGAPEPQVAQEPIRLDLPRRAPDIVTRESVIPPKSKRDEALELYAKGFSADLIAARLGSTVAEIDLLISLEEERRQGARP